MDGKGEAEKIIEEAEDDEDVSEIRFGINGYNDLFSDFDARPTAQRGLSEDFLTEAKRAVAAKPTEKVDFIFLVHKDERKIREEMTIKERLRKHFRKHLEILQGEKSKVLRKGILFVIAGIILMFAATFTLFSFKTQNFLSSFLTVVLEPAGWFLFWEGLDFVIFESKKPDPNIDFNKKMSSARFDFVSI